MMETTTAEIRIGGPIPRILVQDLMTALARDDASHEYGDAVIHPSGQVEVLLNYMYEGTLRFRCVAAPWGEFEATEAFCMQHGIAFDRIHDAFGEWDAERAIFRPGMEVPETIYLDSDGEETVHGYEVRKAIEMLEKNEGEFVGEYRVKKAVQILKGSLSCPVLPPDLEQVTIIPHDQ